MAEMRIVRFDIFCKQCKHEKVDDTKDPCDECLSEPGRVDDRRPLYFEPKD